MAQGQTKKPITKNIVFVGANVAGGKSKWKYWENIIKNTKASVFFLKETKCDQVKQLKMDGFMIFDMVRVVKEVVQLQLQLRQN